MTEAEFRALYERLRAQVPWGPEDRRGALNYITPAEVLTACAQVRLGRTVSLAAPSAADGVDFPVHVLAVNALGLHLMDYLQFDQLAPLCEREGRWTFLCAIAPLRLTGTGSPVNPIAIL
jgi:hypothetical protein